MTLTTFLSTRGTALEEIPDHTKGPIVILLGDFCQIPSLAILGILVLEFEGPTHA